MPILSVWQVEWKHGDNNDWEKIFAKKTGYLEANSLSALRGGCSSILLGFIFDLYLGDFFFVCLFLGCYNFSL